MLSDWLATAADFIQGSTVSLAVTGLSRAGKTVFITSLVHNLLSARHQPYRMPLMRVVGEGRLIAARLAQAGALPRFPYQSNVERMAASPADWPTRTRDLSEIEIEINFRPTGALDFLLKHIGNRTASLRLKIVDYPGEWLLDLPLLTQSYAEWSRATLRLCRGGVRADIGATSSHTWPITAPTLWRATKSRAARMSSIARCCSRRATPMA
jgi:predicted YcjX-like family ATPase